MSFVNHPFGPTALVRLVMEYPSSMVPSLVQGQREHRQSLWHLLWCGRMIKLHRVTVDALDEAFWVAKYNNSISGVEDQLRVGKKLRHLRVQIVHCHPGCA